MSLYEPNPTSWRREHPIDMNCCRVQVYDNVSRNFSQCARKKVVEVDGIGYCTQHSPAKRAERRAKRDEQYARERAASARRYDRPTEYRDALREIAAGHNDPRALAKDILEKWSDLEPARLSAVGEGS